MKQKNADDPLSAILDSIFECSRAQLCLAFIEISCLYDVIDDVINGEGSVPNCTPSYWSVSFTQMNHMTIVYWITSMANNRSLDLILVTSSFQLNCPHQLHNFVTNKSILVLKLFIFRSIDYLCYIFHKIGNMASKIGGAWGVSIWLNSWDWIILAKNAEFPLFIPFSSSLINCLNPFRPLGMNVFSLYVQTNSLSSLSECDLNVSFPLVTLCMPRCL